MKTQIFVLKTGFSFLFKTCRCNPSIKKNKKSKTSKDNYRTISALPNMSEIYDFFTTKSRRSLMKSYLNISVDFAKDLMGNTAYLSNRK